jgi:hypothetical protein
MARRRRRTPNPQPGDLDVDDLDETPLFDASSELSYIAVTRDEPEEGFLGKLPPTANEQSIRKKWGGGTFTLSPRSAQGKYIKGLGSRTLAIEGDPIFTSRGAEIRYRRAMGLEEPKQQGGEEKLGFGQLMILLDKQGQRAREEAREAADLRMREAEASHARQLELMREDTKRKEAELQLRERRLEAEAKERESRLDREMAAERERQREHTSTMIQLVKEKGAGGGSPVDTLMKGIQLARELGGGTGEGGESDPLTALAANLPDILAEAGKIAAIDRSTSNPRARRAAAPEQPRRRRRGEPEPVQLEGVVALKAAEMIERLQKQGRDPAIVLAQAFDNIARQRSGAPAPAKPPGKPAAAAAPATRARPQAAPPTAKAAARRPSTGRAKMPRSAKAATK